MKIAARNSLFYFLLLQKLPRAAALNHIDPDFTTLCKNAVIERYKATIERYNATVEGHNATIERYYTTINGSNQDLDVPFLVGPLGPQGGPVSYPHAWGVTYKTCTEVCGRIGTPFEFSNFSTAMTQWLLPWVILTSQLPYETSGPYNDMLSFLLAVGSPAFIMFGLVLTMLNRIQIAEGFEELYRLASDCKITEQYSRLNDRLREACYLLIESQQVPMRAHDVDGWLSSLLLHQSNYSWWTNVGRDLANTRRRATISLVVQIIYAFIAWLFTVIVAFDNLGDVVTGLSIASSSIWIWLVPVTYGWVAVGTQAKKGSVADAIRRPANRTKFLGDVADPIIVGKGDAQNGIQATSGTNVQLSTSGIQPSNGHAQGREELLLGSPTGHPGSEKKLPTWFSFSLTGDESKEGPIYNYARIFTHTQFARTIQSGFLNGINAILDDRTDTTTQDMSTLCGFHEPIKAYSTWQSIDSQVWRNISTAAFMGLFLQWGTSGPAILLDYLTSVAGLGCRSFAHVLYGALGTVSFFLLFVASLLSHENMLRYQRESKAPKGPLPFLFVACRLCGIFVASTNAIWLILSTALELSGVFDSCWCNSDRLGLRGDAWILLFKDGPDLAKSSVKYWVGAVVFSSIVSVIAALVIWMGCRRVR